LPPPTARGRGGGPGPRASALRPAGAWGAALGPLRATAAMEWFGHDALFVYVGVVSGGLTLFAGLRRLISGPFRAEP
ncbi:hypothetical protein GAY28_35030, partial [Azospirillum brasilense]|nr:hypothetical protein [Azospirillum brasilense]